MGKYLKWLYFALILAFLYLPILLLAVFSFTDATNIGQIRSFSIHNYLNLFRTEELRSMILGTFLLAIVSATIATVLGSLGAIGSFYSSQKVKRSISVLNQIPVINADVVTGFSICILLVVVLRVDKSSFIPLLIGHTALCSPFVYLAVMPKLKQMDGDLYAAALDLGATPFKALWTVVIPQLMPGILSGFVLAITLSLDDYFITTYTKPASFDTISTYVVNATKGSQTTIKTALWALSTLVFVLVVLIVLLMNWKALRAEKKNNLLASEGNA